ncbi:MAG: hypothetical protein ACU0BF_05455 [Paracoccaceae bacterium]
MDALHVPPFVTVTPLSEASRGDDAFVVSNAATGRHFRANRATVALIEALRGGIRPGAALARAGIDADLGQAILGRLVRTGVAVERGRTQAAPPPKAPPESHLISMRADLFDAAPLARRLDAVGRALFSRWGGVAWALAVVAGCATLAANPERAAHALAQVPQAGLGDWARFLVVFAALKILHEMGHALAYRRMCLREGVDPGPIRMGVAVFAMTPFPFTDVTGAWRLRSRWRRAMIGAGGVYLELLGTAILAIVWGQVVQGPWQVTIFQVAIFTAATSLLFNFNPLIKLDGYYVLSDLTGWRNIAGRAAMAARDTLARALGAQVPRPAARDLIYWALAYAWRWTIFAGIFWLAYRLDARLALPVGALILATLVVRPLVTSLSHAAQAGPRPGRVALALGLTAAALAACLVPLPAWIALDGRLSLHRTSHIHAPEPGRVSVADGAVTLTSPELSFRARDAELRARLADAAGRRVAASAAERARLDADAAALSGIAAEYAGRAARLTPGVQTGARVDLTAARRLSGAWAGPGAGPLATVSRDAAPRVLLWLDQARLEAGALSGDAITLSVRLVADPGCAFQATLDPRPGRRAARDDAFALTAFPLGLPACAAHSPYGAAVVARLDTAPASVAARLRRGAARLLQGRLPGREI